MCPELRRRSPGKQSGSMLVIAIFIVVVMGLLVAALSRTLQSSSETVSFEVLGTRAFYAAQSGLELGLQQLFPLGSLTASCDSVAVSDNFAVQGLVDCSGVVSCSARQSTSNHEVTHFVLTSIGKCESGTVSSQRTVTIEVWQ